MKEVVFSIKLTCDHEYPDRQKCRMFFKFEGDTQAQVVATVENSGWTKRIEGNKTLDLCPKHGK